MAGGVVAAMAVVVVVLLAAGSGTGGWRRARAGGGGAAGGAVAPRGLAKAARGAAVRAAVLSSGCAGGALTRSALSIGGAALLRRCCGCAEVLDGARPLPMALLEAELGREISLEPDLDLGPPEISREIEPAPEVAPARG